MLWHAAAQEAALPITSVNDLRAISGEDAALKRPVHVRGVVTLIDPPQTVFIQHEGAGTFLHLRAGPIELRPGQIVEAEGVTYPGLYVPGIAPASLRVIGESDLPPPRPVTFEQLASGVYNYEWVEVRGIVRSFQEAPEGRGVLALALGDGRLEVHIAQADAAAARALIDARIRLSGLAAGFINDRRQLVAPHLRVAGLAGVHVDEAAPGDPFALPLTPIEQLLRFHPEGAPGHRVRVRGTLTHRQPGQAIFLREGSRGLLVEAAETPALRHGDMVEALGFAEMGAFSAVLRDSMVRKVDDGEPPEPVRLTAAEVLKGTHDADLVALDAIVVDVLRGTGESALVLRAGDIGFQARIEGGEASHLAALRTRSRVRLTGIARATHPDFSGRGFSARQRSFEILLRDAGDVAIIEAAPFWNPRRLGAALGLLAAIAAAAFAWVALLRRRIAAQTAILRVQTHADAAREERERIAREFHDTLEQELTGLMLRLDAASARIVEPKPRELLDGARRLVREVQAGARSLVWNLRQPVLDAAPLSEAILQTIASLREGRRIEVKTEGDARRLPGLVEHELLRVAQEAVTNAVKHGGASRIDISLHFTSREVRLRAADDGRGFDPPGESAKPGHFGLVGMRERVQKLGGQLSIESRPGGGTTVEAVVPFTAL